jgi:hypothetical protein
LKNLLFLIEFCLRIKYDFRAYSLNLWNWFDFTLFIIGLFSLLSDLEYSKSLAASRLFKIFRVFRALKSLKSINVLYKLQIIFNTIIKSLLTMIMFSVFGNCLFANDVDYFKNLGSGMLALLNC